MTNDVRDRLHSILERRGMSHITVSAHQYAVADALEELVKDLVAREVLRLKYAGRDDG